MVHLISCVLRVNQVLKQFCKVYHSRPECVYVCVCVPLASESSETVKDIAKLGTVTASVTRMHHELIILTLTFIQGHTYQNHENNNSLIISETI